MIAQGAKPVAGVLEEKSRSQFWVWSVVLLVLLFNGIIRVRMLDFPLERDEGEFAYTGQLMLQGVPPYASAYFMKLPGTHAMYALIMAVLGQSARGIHLGLLAVNWATIVMVFLLGRRLVGATAGLMACATYGLMSVSDATLGLAAHATNFVVLFAMAGLLALCRAQTSGRGIHYFLSGLSFGLAALMKQPGLLFMVFGGLMIGAWELETRPIPWSRFIRRGLLFAAAGVLPFLLTCLLMWRAGVFKAFWFWTVTVVSSYGSRQSLALGWGMLMLYCWKILKWNVLIWALTAVGLLCLCLDRRAGAGKRFILVLLFISISATSQGMYFRPHYFLLVLPAMGLVIGAGMTSAQRFLAQRGALARALPVAVFAGVFLAVTAGQFDTFFRASAISLCRYWYFATPFPESPEIGRYIHEHTSKDSRVAVFGSEPQIYFYSGRRSATGYLYTYDMMESLPFARQMQEQMMQEVESNRPEMMVLVKMPLSWNANENSDWTIMNWADQYCHDHYDLTGVVEIPDKDPATFHWDKDVAPFVSDQSRGDRVYVYKRKTEPR